MASAAAWMLLSAALPACAVEVMQVFRTERFTRGNVNLRKIQEIDDAAWIWIDGGKWTAKERPMARFRRDFTGCGDTLRIDVSGDARFVLLLDGKVIARGPHKGFVEHWYYQTYDITGLGTEPHRMEAVVFDLGSAGPFSIPTSGKCGFALKASGKYDTMLTTGKADWLASEVRGLEFGGITDPETMTGFENVVHGTGFLDQECRNWRKCAVVGAPVKDDEYGVSRKLWALFPTERFDQISVLKSPGAVKASQFAYDETNICYTAADGKREWTAKFDAMVRGGAPVTVPPKTKIRFLWDMGDYYCGYPVLRTCGGKGARIRWAWAESLYNAEIVGDIHANRGNRNEFVGKVNRRSMYDTFLCDGRSGATFTTPWWKSGRWIELSVETAGEPVTLEKMTIEESRYPMECEAKFECDDPSIPAILDMCVRGMQNCLHETFMDCPYFEQQMYPGDTRVEMLVLRTMFSDPRPIRHGIGIFDYARRNNGLVPMNFPCRSVQDSSTYSMCWVMMLGDYALWNGPDEFLRARIPGMRQTLSAIGMYRDGDGLLADLPGWSFLDWVPEWDMYGNAPDGRRGKSALNNLLYVAALKSAAAAERSLGDLDMAECWSCRAERLAKAVVARFWSEERGMLADTSAKDRFSEHAQCIALLNGVLPADKADRAFKGLIGAKDLARTTVYFSHYLFETFLKFGRADLVLKRFDLWRGFVADGMKTPIEAPGWRGRSECHAWGTHPMYHLLTGVAGIKPAADGFSRVRIAPDSGGLEFIRAQCPTPKGAVEVDLRFGAGEVSGTATLPEGLTGEFVWKGKTTKLEEGVNKL